MNDNNNNNNNTNKSIKRNKKNNGKKENNANVKDINEGGKEKKKLPPRRRKASAKPSADNKVSPKSEKTGEKPARKEGGGRAPGRGAKKTTPKRIAKRAEVLSPKGAAKKENYSKKELRGEKLRVIPLGGLGEIGKNMTALEYGDDIIVIDSGMGFPDDDMLGIDLVIPDISYLVKNADKVRGILITHGHEDHIGAVPYVLAQIRVPVYGTRLSLGIIEGKLEEKNPGYEPDLYTVEAGDVVELGVFKAEFIHVNHSIADACAICVRTPVGTVFHTGDFKIDVSPIDGQMIDITRIGEIGRAGVELLLCESTNAERAGYTLSERTVGSSLERIFMQHEDKRLIIATFSSNVHRVQQIIDACARHGRKVAVLGRSMVNVIGAAAELGYMELPDGLLIDASEIKRYRPNEICLITTGSQGEPMSALYRIAFDAHDKVKISSGDVVVLSSSAIPGNEKLVGKIINALVKNGVKVVNDSVEDVHVSGHACREEMKLIISLLKPKYFMPIHGEARHLYANKETAEFMGIPSDRIFISEIGKVLEMDRRSAKFNGTVPSGKVLVDGSGVGEIGNVVLRDRKLLAEEGLVIVVATVDFNGGYVVSGPDIVSRGFVYVKESEKLVDGARRVAAAALEKTLDNGISDFAQIKNNIRDELAKFIYKETKRKPMILPVLMDV